MNADSKAYVASQKSEMLNIILRQEKQLGTSHICFMNLSAIEFLLL